jgi:hypothetical protein
VIGIWAMRAVATSQTSPPPADAAEAAAVSIPYRAAPSLHATKSSGGIHWKSLFRDWWVNLVMEQTERILKEPKTRDQLSGPFIHDWLNTVSLYRFDRWDDTDKFITSNLGHPAQGAVVAAIFWQNDGHVRFSDQDFHNAAYRKALLQAFAFVTFDAVQWKLGPDQRSQHR